MNQEEKYSVQLRGGPASVGLMEVDLPERQVNLTLRKTIYLVKCLHQHV